MSNRITILSFSSRRNGNCANIAKYISNRYVRTNVRHWTVDAALFAPCGSCDCECLKPGMTCPQVSPEQKRVMDAICDSDLVYFVVPNYCGYPCANYFAFNERSVGYFGMDRGKMERYMKVRKRFIIVSNTEGFEEAMHQQTTDEPEILYMKSRKYHKQSVAGDLLDSEAARADLDAFLNNDGLAQ